MTTNLGRWCRRGLLLLAGVLIGQAASRWSQSAIDLLDDGMDVFDERWQ